MMEFTTIKLTLEQEAHVRAAELEIDQLELEELRVCLKLATRSDLIKNSIIQELAQQPNLPEKRRPRVIQRVRSTSR